MKIKIVKKSPRSTKYFLTMELTEIQLQVMNERLYAAGWLPNGSPTAGYLGEELGRVMRKIGLKARR